MPGRATATHARPYIAAGRRRAALGTVARPGRTRREREWPTARAPPPRVARPSPPPPARSGLPPPPPAPNGRLAQSDTRPRRRGGGDAPRKRQWWRRRPAAGARRGRDRHASRRGARRAPAGHQGRPQKRSPPHDGRRGSKNSNQIPGAHHSVFATTVHHGLANTLYYFGRTPRRRPHGSGRAAAVARALRPTLPPVPAVTTRRKGGAPREGPPPTQGGQQGVWPACGKTSARRAARFF